MSELKTAEEIAFELMQLGKINNQIKDAKPLLIFRSDYRSIAGREKLTNGLIDTVKIELQNHHNIDIVMINENEFILFSQNQKLEWPTIKKVKQVQETISNIDNEKYNVSAENPFT